MSLACAPLLALELVEPRVIADAVSGTSGAGRGLKTTSLFAEANENVSAYGLLTHRHTAEMEQALSKVAGEEVQVLFTPHLVPTTRGILATCYARPTTSGLSTARLLEHYREFYADDPCVVVVDEPSGTKATYGANVAHVTVRFDARTDTVVAIAAEDNLVKGASRAGDPGRQPAARAARDHRPPARGRAAVSITAAKGFVAGGLAVRHQGVGRSRPRARRDRRRATRRGRGGVHDEPRAGRARADLTRAPRRRARRGGGAQLRQRQRRNRGGRGGGDAAACASWPADGLGSADHRRAGVLDRPHRHPDAHGRARSGHPGSSAVRCGVDGGGDAAQAMLTTDTVRKEATAKAGGAIVGGMAKGAAMLSPAMATMLAVLTTDAAVDPGVLQQALAQGGRRHLRLSEC